MLAADHAERRLGQLARDLRRLVRQCLTQRLREQGVAGEDRVGFAEPGPDGRKPAPDLVVVERRQVVVDEEKECTSSTAAAAGRTSTAVAPAASPVARQITGRTRLPPSANA